MLGALGWNLDRDRKDLRLYEAGKIYVAKPVGAEKLGELPEERRVLTLGLTGTWREKRLDEEEKNLHAGFSDLKGDIESLLEAFDSAGVRFDPESSSCYEPGFAGRLAAAGAPEARAMFGRLRGARAREYKFPQEVWLAEIDYDQLLGLKLKARTFRPFSKFPAVERDFSLLVPAGIPYSRLAEALSRSRVEEVMDTRPVELLPEGKIEPGHYSLLLRVRFQSPSRTLTGEETATLGQRLVNSLALLGVRLRS